ncbi:Hypothetical predicted protein [Prunus dulcis]|uniref:Uncharacterized protein n=1 Tax=Prunus dulcis TaxID=3755 RepID=A0A5E4GG58_PRUDU|nr:Hypothetical predicted protein [Prunus dulcis]
MFPHRRNLSPKLHHYSLQLSITPIPPQDLCDLTLGNHIRVGRCPPSLLVMGLWRKEECKLVGSGVVPWLFWVSIVVAMGVVQGVAEGVSLSELSTYCTQYQLIGKVGNNVSLEQLRDLSNFKLQW